MHRREYILASGAVLGASSIGAVAFTSANLSRDITININADDTAIIGLNPNVSGVQLNGDVLEISPDSGLNPDADFYYGDGSKPTDTPAFTIANNDTTQKYNYTVGLTADLSIDLYDGTGSGIGTVTQSNDVVEQIGAGEKWYTVFSVNTTGMSGGETIDGNLTIDASAP